MRKTERDEGGLDGGYQSEEEEVGGLVSCVHHLRHVGHSLGEEGRVLQVPGQVLHRDIAVHPGLLPAAD